MHETHPRMDRRRLTRFLDSPSPEAVMAVTRRGTGDGGSVDRVIPARKSRRSVQLKCSRDAATFRLRLVPGHREIDRFIPTPRQARGRNEPVVMPRVCVREFHSHGRTSTHRNRWVEVLAHAQQSLDEAKDLGVTTFEKRASSPKGAGRLRSARRCVMPRRRDVAGSELFERGENLRGLTTSLVALA